MRSTTNRRDHPDKRSITSTKRISFELPLRWHLITGVFWSLVPAFQFAVNLASTARPERLWLVLTATAISALGLINCFRWKLQRDQSTERGEGE